MGGVFRREGDVWTIDHRAGVFRLKHTKGLQYIAQLLANPGREIHVVDLVATAEGEAALARGAAVGGRQLVEEGLASSGLGDAGAILDPAARRAYKERLRDLEEDLDEAAGFNDPDRAAKIRAEIEALKQQLAGAVGLGGRARKAGSVAERARVNVRNSIASALRAIGRHDADLRDHLTQTIRTGAYCSYVGGEMWNAAGRSTKGQASGLRLMLVDDHPMWRATLRQVLEERSVGQVVSEAADGTDAVEALEAARPDVVIMDIELPTMSGVEATRHLVAAQPDLKVLVLSSSDRRKDVVEAVRAGASGYLVKTAEPEAVADAVARIHRGELVFPPAVARAVLDEFRRIGRHPPSPAERGGRRPSRS